MKIPFRSISVIALLLFASVVVSRRAHGLDLEVYRAAGRSLLEGRTDLYARDFAINASLDYHYPPVFLFLFLPLVLVSNQLAAFIWTFLTLGIVYVAVQQIKLVTNDIFRLAHIKFWVVSVVASLLCMKYFLFNLKYLNVHLIVLSLTVIAWCLVIRRKLILASALLAGAIAFKVFPALLLPYFLLKGEFRFVVLTIAFLTAFAVVRCQSFRYPPLYNRQ